MDQGYTLGNSTPSFLALAPVQAGRPELWSGCIVAITYRFQRLPMCYFRPIEPGAASS